MLTDYFTEITKDPSERPQLQVGDVCVVEERLGPKGLQAWSRNTSLGVVLPCSIRNLDCPHILVLAANRNHGAKRGSRVPLPYQFMLDRQYDRVIAPGTDHVASGPILPKIRTSDASIGWLIGDNWRDNPAGLAAARGVAHELDLFYPYRALTLILWDYPILLAHMADNPQLLEDPGTSPG